MSSKKSQGHGGTPPAPSPEEPLAPVVPAPVAMDTVVAETPIGTLPAEPFEPPLPIPPADPSAGAEAAREALAKLEQDRKEVEVERENLKSEREGLEKALAKLEQDRKQLESDREAFEEDKKPKKKREPRLIEVKAVRGLIDPLRVQHRVPGEVFRMREDLAEELEDRGDVEIL